jgi:hypothetical protein
MYILVQWPVKPVPPIFQYTKPNYIEHLGQRLSSIAKVNGSVAKLCCLVQLRDYIIKFYA